MGFGDIFKKAIEKGTVLAEDALKKGVALAEKKGLFKSEETIQVEKAEAERLAAEEEQIRREQAAKRKEAAERKKQERLAEITKPSCEKGDCLWHAGYFYFTCDDCTECQRKKTTKKKWGTNLAHPDLWPYMKRIEYVNNIKDNPEKLFKEQDAFIKDFMEEQMPAFKSHKEVVKLNFIHQGITFDNPFFTLLWYLKDKNVKLSHHMMDKLQWQNINGTFLHLDLDFYKNESLYKRNDKEFDYTVKIFETVMDEEKLSEYYDPNTVDINDLYNSKGNIKAAGLGGPEAGFYGDTIWNTVESWDEN